MLQLSFCETLKMTSVLQTFLAILVIYTIGMRTNSSQQLLSELTGAYFSLVISCQTGGARCLKNTLRLQAADEECSANISLKQCQIYATIIVIFTYNVFVGRDMDCPCTLQATCDLQLAGPFFYLFIFLFLVTGNRQDWTGGPVTTGVHVHVVAVDAGTAKRSV